jgi:hypothetical protein
MLWEGVVMVRVAPGSVPEVERAGEPTDKSGD